MTGFWDALSKLHVTAAIHMAHFVKNLGGTLVDFHSVGRIKYAQKTTGAIKKQMLLKKSSKTNTYNILQQLTGLAPQQQLLVLGMTMVSCWLAAIREIIYIHSSIIQFFPLSIEHIVELSSYYLFFLVFGF